MKPRFWLSVLILAAPPMHSQACLRFLEEEVSPSVVQVSLKDSLQTHESRSVWEERARVRKEEADKQWDFRSQNNLTVALVHLGRLDEALDRMETVERNYPNQIATAYNLGTVYELKNDLPKAQFWIKKGVEREFLAASKNHLDGTEWLHLRILDAKIGQSGDPNFLQKHEVSGLDFGSGRVPTVPLTFPAGNGGKALTLTDVQVSLREQLHERLEFVKAPDPIMGDLLFDFANTLAVSGSMEDAAEIYQMALPFAPSRAALAKTRFDYFAGTPNYLLIGCLCSVALGLTGIFFVKRKKLQQQEWQTLPVQNLDDLGPERKTAYLDFSQQDDR
ncbi:tetratricopeptide repeat protein [bacterium]|nr:MAG: tetratricopeptide repeat protein [bacterium]